MAKKILVTDEAGFTLTPIYMDVTSPNGERGRDSDKLRLMRSSYYV